MTALASLESGIDGAARVIKCLGHPLRLRLVEQLDGRESSVSELVRAAGASQSAVSHQLAILRGHGVVVARRDGPFVRYRLVEPRFRRILECVRGCDETMAGAPDAPSGQER